MLIHRLKLIMGLVALVVAVACDPCKNLAEKICDCERSTSLREMCHRSLDAYSQMKGFDRALRPEQCQEILDRKSCTCMALNDGLVENCGMTR